MKLKFSEIVLITLRSLTVIYFAVKACWDHYNCSEKIFEIINAEQVYTQFCVYLYLCQLKCNHMYAINTYTLNN